MLNRKVFNWYYAIKSYRHSNYAAQNGERRKVLHYAGLFYNAQDEQEEPIYL